MSKIKVGIVGDSFVEGVGDELGGWATQLSRKLQDRCSFSIDGLGGRNILACRKACNSLIREFRPNLLIVCVGINDSRFRESLNSIEVPKDTFYAEYEQLVISALNSNVKKCILLGLSRVDEDLVYNYKPDKSHTNSNAELLDKVVAQVAIDTEQIYIPIAHMISVDTDEITLSDGLHPNNLGHKIIMQSVLDTLSDHQLV